MSYGLLITHTCWPPWRLQAQCSSKSCCWPTCTTECRAAASPVEQALGTRATAVMPWVLLVLYFAGAGLAWQHHARYWRTPRQYRHADGAQDCAGA